MTPSIEIRLASMVRALSTVIIPALAREEGIAAEQAKLVLGHIQVIREQLDIAPRYERFELLAARKLAQALLAAVDGGKLTVSAATALAAIVAVPASSLEHIAGIRAQRHETAAAVERLLAASGDDGSPEFLRRSHELVLYHGRETARRERKIFEAMGFDGAVERNETMADMLAMFEREVQ